MIQVIGPRTYPPNNIPAKIRTHDGAVALVVNTTSRGSWKGLSPFHCGPVPLYEERGLALLVENAWQFAKVYPSMIDPVTGLPDARYWQWAQAGWASNAPQRYPMGKGASYAYLWWGAAHGPLTRAQGRRLIYVPGYARAVTQTEATR